MAKAKVFFTDLSTRPGKNLLDKLENLVKKAGLLNVDFEKKFTAIKIHFGEPGNLAYIRPNYAGRLVKLLKSRKAYVFLTDSNTLYKGRRSNAVDHIESAFENGFNPLSVGCPVIIADGLKGTEYQEIEINQKHCKTAKIGSAIANADIIISMNHFKGHELTGFGGAIKNLGMGSGSIGGKLEMHSNGQPKIVLEKCVGCKMCELNCAHNAIKVNNKKAVIDYALCVGCGQCVAVCMYDAAQPRWDSRGAQEKIAEYALAALKNKVGFHINFVMNVSSNCDCWSHNDIAIVPDIGILASFDPVAVDRASVDLVNSAPPIITSCIGEKYNLAENKDKFTLAQPHTDWRLGLDYAEKIGLGTQDYELIKVE
ncbi:MAG: DUF362 domain-containing protein [Brevinematia bacterium]